MVGLASGAGSWSISGAATSANAEPAGSSDSADLPAWQKSGRKSRAGETTTTMSDRIAVQKKPAALGALIFATLDAVDGTKRIAAETLGKSLKTLYSRLKRYMPDSESLDAAQSQQTQI